MKFLPYPRLLLAAALLLASQSCQDLLKEDLVSQVGAEYLTTPDGFEAAVRATYASLRDYYGRENGMTVTVFGTDTYTMAADGSFKFVNQYTAGLNPTALPFRELWINFYTGINTANTVIAQAPNVTGLDEATKKRRIAEVKFLRAHHYFLLVQMFGPVPLVLTQSTEPNKVATRTPVRAVYDAILNDLESALPDLAAPTGDYGRVTKGAAEHLLARVYLTKATSEAAAADDYAKAATYAQNVITKYSYKLVPDFADVFAQGTAENSSEVVFATQYTSESTTNGIGNETHLYFGMVYDEQAGMQRDVFYGRPFRRFRPTPYAYNVVFADKVNDSRYQKSFRSTYLSNKPGTYSNLFDNSKPPQTSLTFKAGDTAIYLPGYEMPQALRATKPYQVLVPSQYSGILFPTLSKFLDALRPDLSHTAGSRDFLMFRLAETHLIAAEALLKQGKTVEALAHVNTVRRRAAFPGKEAAMQITAAQLTMDFLMEERERELIGEMFRWFDLKRWGKLEERVKLYNDDAKANIKPYHVLRPIPIEQIDRTAGGATAFPQNPGY